MILTEDQLSVEVLADTINVSNGCRLTTFLWIYPRFFHQEVLTHRALSRNSASSRAVPTLALTEQVLQDPAMPWHIYQNCAGMQGYDDLPAGDREEFLQDVLTLRDSSLGLAQKWGKRVHKQTLNRYLEPWMKIAVVATATDWGNFFWLRNHRDAEPHLRQLADMVCRATYGNIPVWAREGDVHTPYVSAREREELLAQGYTMQEVFLVSAARCGRVSFFRQGLLEDKTVSDDIQRGEGFTGSGHWSPTEHQATALGSKDRETYSGNLRGWKQARKEYVGLENRRAMLESPACYRDRP